MSSPSRLHCRGEAVFVGWGGLIKCLPDNDGVHADPVQGSTQPDHPQALISNVKERLGRKWSYALASVIMITETLLQVGKDGVMEVKEEYQEKLRYLAERGDEARQDHPLIGIAVLENQTGKVN